MLLRKVVEAELPSRAGGFQESWNQFLESPHGDKLPTDMLGSPSLSGVSPNLQFFPSLIEGFTLLLSG